MNTIKVLPTLMLVQYHIKYKDTNGHKDKKCWVVIWAIMLLIYETESAEESISIYLIYQ